jgi:ABC-type branched-subunit amino acid transport system substrate-binding protein
MTPNLMPRSRRAAVPLLAAGALLSGCGVVPGTGGDGAPIVVMTWAPVGTRATNMPGMIAMAQAYEKYVNDSGGLGGRPLTVLTCNEKNDPAAVADCARRAADAGAVAVVGSYSEQGRTFTPALQARDIPYVGGYGIAEEEFVNPQSYPVNGGMPALLVGSGEQLADACGKVALVRPDTATGDQFPRYLDKGLAHAGHGAAGDLRTPDDASSYADVARRAVGDDRPGDCVSAVLGDHTATFVDSLRRTGDRMPRVRLSSVIGSVRQSLVDATGGAHSPLEGALVTDWYPPASDPRWDEMKNVVKKYAFSDDRIDTADPGVQTTWIAYTVLSEVIGAMDPGTPVTSRTLQRALDRTTGLSTGGLTPDLGWSDDDILSITDYARLPNLEVTFQVVRDGRLEQDRPGFADMAPALDVSRLG